MAERDGASRDLTRIWLALAVAGLVAGIALYAGGSHDAAHVAWAITTVVGIIPLGWSTIVDLLHRRTGVDLIALLAMIGALAVGQVLAGAVIALMLSSGQALEAYANRRAHKELSALVERAPQRVTRYEDGRLVERPIGEVLPADRLFVKTGEVVPVDGLLLTGGVFDESALTGEARPVERSAGELVRSGAVVAGAGVDLQATATAELSTYAGIVRLVAEAENDKAPFVRLADRYAVIFIPVTLAIAAGAWLVTGDAVRALAVLVVATPCPLILAAPIAIVAGISRAARRGIIVKSGGALELLGQGEVLLFDKTGTLTAGTPEVSDIEVFGSTDPDEALRLAASLDQVSPHVLASAIVSAARRRNLTLSFPDGVSEQHGFGITGKVDGRLVSLGKASFVAPNGVPPQARDVRRRTSIDGSSCVFVAIDGETAAAIVIDDPIRPDTPRVIRSLRRAGIKRIVMVTGDHPDVAESVGVALGVDRVLSERDPSDKVEAVKAEREAGGVTIMVGDGINDAPALAAADVGVAMGARGATASSEAADVVLVVDRLDRVADAMSIARRSRSIALQSVWAGMGLSFAAMFFGAFGLLLPVAGAIVQEAIDVAVILNALRALRGEKTGPRAPGQITEVGERFRAEHKEFGPSLAKIRQVADRLGTMDAEELRNELEEVRWFLLERLPEHEEEEEAIVYPVVAALMGGEDPMGSMSRAHLEISHLGRLFSQLLADLPPSGPDAEDLMDLRRVLYGLHAILRLHFAQEEEAYAWLASEDEELSPAR